MAKVNLREVVLMILMDVLEDKQHSHKVINATIEKYAYLDKQERSFIKILSEGTIENLIQLDYVINEFSNIKVKKMKPEIRNILRLSVYQILYLDSIPDHSVCDEAVKLTIATKKYKQLKGFVNGVLRTICREGLNLKYPSVAIRHSLPQWIYNQWVQQYGRNLADEMCKSINRVPVTTIRPGKNVTSEVLIDKLISQGIGVKRNKLIPDALEIDGIDNIKLISGFNEGDFYIQDISSMFVGMVADPKPNSICLDMCAAPGGKSLHLAKLLNNTGSIISRDLTNKKVELLNDNIKRSGFTNIKVEQFDASVLDEQMVESMDLVICDVPCSGLGVMSRKSDIKYNISPEIQKELVELQRKIVINAAKYVKPGGVLVYSTCTTNVEENINNIRWLLESVNLKTVSITEYLPKELRSKDTDMGYIQLLPGINNTDGFFICKMLKGEN